MAETKEFEGRTEEEAVANACEALGVEIEDLDYTVLDEGSDGVLGLGKRPVQIRVSVVDIEDEGDVEDDGDVEDEGDVDAAEEPTSVGDEAADRSVDEDVGGIVGPAPEKAAAAGQVAEGLVQRMGIECQVEVRDEETQIVILINEASPDSTDVADTLGRSRPPAIPSFQFLLNKIVNRFPEDRKHIVVEVPSVPRRERRPEEPTRTRELDADDDLDPSLVELARLLADRAVQLEKVITIHPMAAGDRRAVHKTVMSVDGVQTVSEGEGLYRKMHIVPDSLREDGGRRKRRRRRRRRGNDEGDAVDGGVDASASQDGDEDADTEEE